MRPEGASLILGGGSAISANKKAKKREFYRWSYKENRVYAKFLHKFKDDFVDEWTRRSTRVFKRLQKLLPSKTISQCKSHHQKMLASNGSIEKII